MSAKNALKFVLRQIAANTHDPSIEQEAKEHIGRLEDMAEPVGPVTSVAIPTLEIERVAKDLFEKLLDTNQKKDPVDFALIKKAIEEEVARTRNFSLPASSLPPGAVPMPHFVGPALTMSPTGEVIAVPVHAAPVTDLPVVKGTADGPQST